MDKVDRIDKIIFIAGLSFFVLLLIISLWNIFYKADYYECINSLGIAKCNNINMQYDGVSKLRSDVLIVFCIRHINPRVTEIKITDAEMGACQIEKIKKG